MMVSPSSLSLTGSGAGKMVLNAHQDSRSRVCEAVGGLIAGGIGAGSAAQIDQRDRADGQAKEAGAKALEFLHRVGGKAADVALGQVGGGI